MGAVDLQAYIQHILPGISAFEYERGADKEFIYMEKNATINTSKATTVAFQD